MLLLFSLGFSWGKKLLIKRKLFFGLLARNGFSDEYACEGIGYDMDA
jgi:hypothetical protein